MKNVKFLISDMTVVSSQGTIWEAQICGLRRPGSQGATPSWVRCGSIQVAGAQQYPTTQHCLAVSARARLCSFVLGMSQGLDKQVQVADWL